jgi:hypothetical protein|tara:strand:+ start:9866 stop:10090 length:225 start_codon:yes stop_codon:yes gene_type:complete
MEYKDIIELLVKKPMVVFVILSALFGYGYYEQNQELQTMSVEIGGLRVEQTKMHEIIQLKIELAELSCPILGKY